MKFDSDDEADSNEYNQHIENIREKRLKEGKAEQQKEVIDCWEEENNRLEHLRKARLRQVREEEEQLKARLREAEEKRRSEKSKAEGYQPQGLTAKDRGRRWDDDERRMIAAVGPGGWEYIPSGIMIDSGAAESVADPKTFPGYGVRRHERPIFYQSATGEPITNIGEQEVALVTGEGSVRGMKFQATESVRKPLASVKRIVEAGHAVVFAPDSLGGSFILNLETYDENSLREDDGSYVLGVWVPPNEVAVGSLGFARHP